MDIASSTEALCVNCNMAKILRYAYRASGLLKRNDIPGGMYAIFFIYFLNVLMQHHFLKIFFTF